MLQGHSCSIESPRGRNTHNLSRGMLHTLSVILFTIISPPSLLYFTLSFHPFLSPPTFASTIYSLFTSPINSPRHIPPEYSLLHIFHILSICCPLFYASILCLYFTPLFCTIRSQFIPPLAQIDALIGWPHIFHTKLPAVSIAGSWNGWKPVAMHTSAEGSQVVLRLVKWLSSS